MIGASLGAVTRIRSIAMGLMALFAVPILTILPGSATRAVEPCMDAPDRKPPDGSHWYYWTDRTTQQKCWFLAPEKKVVQQVSSHASSRIPPEKVTAVGRAVPTLEPPPTRQTQEATSIGNASVMQRGDQPQRISAEALAKAVMTPLPSADWRVAASTDEEEEEEADTNLEPATEKDLSILAPLRMVFAIAFVFAITGILRRMLSRFRPIPRTRRAVAMRDRPGFTHKPERNGRTGSYPHLHTMSDSRPVTGMAEPVDPFEDFEEAIRSILAARTRKSLGRLAA